MNFGVFWSFFSVAILVYTDYIKKILNVQTERSDRPPKKFSHTILGRKSGFESIMVTNPIFDVLRFVFLKLPRAKGKMDIFGGQINVQFWGVKMDIFGSWIFLFLNEIFSTVLSLKHDLADAQNPTFTNYLF
jgi:hypothetical protein